MIKKHKSHHSGKVSLRRKRSQRKRSQRKRSQRKSQRRDGMEESKKTIPDEVEVPEEFKELKAKIDEVNREKKKILGEFPDKIHEVEAFMEDQLCGYDILGFISIDEDEGGREKKTTLIRTIKRGLEENEMEIKKVMNEMKATSLVRPGLGRNDYPKLMTRNDEMFEFIDYNSYY